MGGGKLQKCNTVLI